MQVGQHSGYLIMGSRQKSKQDLLTF